MRCWMVLGLLLLGSAPASAQGVGLDLSAPLPDGVDDVSQWETVSGEFETPVARGAYRFHVNPRRPALYQVMRYRVELLAPSTSLQKERGSGERVAFVRRPGTPEPILCWELLVVGADPRWREVVAGTPQYQLEMAMLLQVLAVHRTARATATH